MWLLAADVGGTNTRLLAVDTRQPDKSQEAVYASQDYPDLETIIQTFKQTQAISRISSACLAVAGPVQQGRAAITNLPWRIDAVLMAKATDIGKLTLVNDFTSVAHGLAVLDEKDFVTLQTATPEVDGTIAILGAGTGLGQAILAYHPDGRIVVASEGGHVDFAPTDEEEIQLLQYWRKRLGRVTYETILSGPGVVRLFEFYADYLKQPPKQQLTEAMQAQDPAAVICEQALIYKQPVAQAAMKRFVHIYAAQAANLALNCKATGGVYLAGGIAPRIITLLQSDDFIAAFNNKQPMQALMAGIPVKVIMNNRVGLLGALEIARCNA